MEYTKKMILMPSEHVCSSLDNELISKIVNISLKLANIKAYNDNGNIIGINGEYTNTTKIEDYIADLMENDRHVDKYFIELLNKAGVSPVLLNNVKAKEELGNLYKTPNNKPNRSTNNAPKKVIKRKSKYIAPIKWKFLSDSEDE